MAEAAARELVERRNVVEIKRLEYMIEAQELEILELEAQIESKRINIKASREAMKKAEANISALDNDKQEGVNDG